MCTPCNSLHGLAHLICLKHVSAATRECCQVRAFRSGLKSEWSHAIYSLAATSNSKEAVPARRGLEDKPASRQAWCSVGAQFKVELNERSEQPCLSSIDWHTNRAYFRHLYTWPAGWLAVCLAVRLCGNCSLNPPLAQQPT